MSQVMPSQVVQTIDELFPHAAQGRASHSPAMTGIISLAKAIPPELISVSSNDYADFVLAISTIEYHLRVWQARGNVGGMAPVKGMDAISIIRQVLVKCPDEFPPSATTELIFIGDRELRNSIRRDLGAATRAFDNSEWKAATVLAGAAIEALLLWKLQEPPLDDNAVQFAAKAVTAAGKCERPKPDLDRWNLDQYIEVATHLDIIRGDTPSAAKLAQNFRNLIHPGRAARLGADL
ncbi:hypothetical protein [Methylosinus sporium]|uniref:hypothetical protein n=1 Tax=Methylosinus sporium TaxID=428 RepID=UPI0011B264E6|nr:hypothetical protein [Methylosinus sporium]